jgi:hypothetical protein
MQMAARAAAKISHGTSAIRSLSVTGFLAACTLTARCAQHTSEGCGSGETAVIAV